MTSGPDPDYLEMPLAPTAAMLRNAGGVPTLEQHFRTALGRTMVDEIGRLRLERAKRLLVQSDAPIKELAHDDSVSPFASPWTHLRG